VRVIAEVMPPDQLRDRMAIEAIGNTDLFDIGYHSPGWFGSFHEHVIDMTPYMEQYGFDVSAYPELVVEAHMTSPTRPGEYIAIPHTPTAPILIARKDFFEHPDERAAFEAEYGRELDYPDTWQELYEVAQFFTRDAGETVAGEVLEQPLYGWSDSMRHPSGIARAYIVMLYSAGIQGWDENFEPDVTHPIVAESIGLFKNMVEDVVPPAAVNWDFLEHLEYYREGRLAMATLWQFGIDTVEDPNGQAAGNNHYRPLPMYEGNLGGYTQGKPYLGGGGLFIFDTPKQEEAFKFLQWLLEENSQEWALRTQAFPRADNYEDPEVLNQYPYYADFVPALGQGLQEVFIRQGVPEYGSAMWQGTGDFALDVVSGDLTIEQAQERWAERMRREFERAGYYAN
jgi:multiple sugar transport system substrate-binding protein